MDLVKSGIEGLDAILEGGTLPLSSILIQGAPGAGKTTFGFQWACQGAVEYGDPAIIVTFERILEEVYRDALAFGWDLRNLEAEGKARVIRLETDALHSWFAERQSEAMNAITDAALELGARRIFVDGVGSFRHFDSVGREQRDALSRFIVLLKGMGLTALMTCELTDLSPDTVQEEEFICDCVVRLHYSRHARRENLSRRRAIEVVKVRGRPFVEGLHPFRFTPSGIRVVPLDAPDPFLADGAPPPLRQAVADLRAAVDAISMSRDETERLRCAAGELERALTAMLEDKPLPCQPSKPDRKEQK